MGKIGAFLNLNRVEAPERPPAEAVGDFREFVARSRSPSWREQASRCMECGVPFCHQAAAREPDPRLETTSSTATVGKKALEQLHRTNNFPSSPAGSALRRARRRACSRSTKGTPSRSSKSSSRS